MTMSIAMIMNLLGGTMVIKNKRFKNPKKRRVNAYCLASIKVVGLVHTRRREERDRKTVGVIC